MVDLPADITTTAVVTVGGSLSDTLEVVGDRDWIRVTLTAGQTYTITLNATGADPLEDPYLYFYNSSGLLLDSDDDGGTSGLNSSITYTVLTTGTYYIGAASFGDGDAGDYTVSVVIDVPPPPDVPLDALDWGTTVADNTVTVYFAPAGQTYDGITSEGFNAFETARFQAAFDLLESVSGLTFTIVNSAAAADFKLVLDTNENNGDYLGYFNPPGELNAGVGVFSGQLWDRTAGGSLEAGGYDFVTITHEVLHGLGFAHPHDEGGGSAIMHGVDAPFDDYGDFNLNQGIFTTMSYNTGFFTGTPGSEGDPGFQWGYECGPMALDIALLQDKYGANATTNSTATTYQLAQSNTDGTRWQAIWDTGSTDVIRNGGSGACVIDLRAATLNYGIGGGGFVSAVNGIAGGFTIANGVVIENAVGGSGNDRLTGNGFNNTLNGIGGVDTMAGGLGNDTYFVNLMADVITEATGGGTRDTVIASGIYALQTGVEVEVLKTIDAAATTSINLTGNNVAQTLIGNAGANRLNGGSGNDTITGGVGADVFVFTTALASNIDRLTDYAVAADRIELNDAAFTGLALGALATSAFVANLAGAATNGLQRIIYETDTGFLWFDADGNGTTSAKVQFADLAGGLAILAGEFSII